MEKETIKNGVKASTPVMASYVALGMACGVVLEDAGFSLAAIAAMSLLVYSGAAQFLSASMIVMGATNPAIVLTVFFLNLRHVLMSASISEYVKKKSLGFLALFSQTLTDESFGVNYTKFREDGWTANEALVLNLSNYSTWAISTVVGGWIGSQLTINTLIMNYALIAMFVCMMVNQFVSREYIVTAVVAVVLTVMLTILLQHNIALVIAALIASCVGYALERKKEMEKGVKENEH